MRFSAKHSEEGSSYRDSTVYLAISVLSVCALTLLKMLQQNIYNDVMKDLRG